VVEDKGAVRLAREQLDSLSTKAAESGEHGNLESKEKAQKLALGYLKEKAEAAEQKEWRISHELYKSESHL